MKKVYNVYDKIFDWFDQHRNKDLMESYYLNLILDNVPSSGKVLDLGCGTGEPLANFFIEKGFNITGVDGSKKMIEICENRFPKERWIVSDMLDINLDEQFDVVLAWHSFFHLDHDSQRSMIKVFESHTKPGGILAFTSGVEEGEVWGNNGGESLYHASLSTQEYQDLLTASSFNVLVHKIEDPECGDATIWISQKQKK